MIIYKLKDECEIETHRTDFDWCVYYYEDHMDEYYGSGTSVAYSSKENLLYVKNLGHCSCFGPMDTGYYTEEVGVGVEGGEAITPEDFLKEAPDPKSMLTENEDVLIYKKVKELLEAKYVGSES